MSALVLITLTVICLGVPFLLKFFIKKYRFWKLVNKIPGPDGGFVLGSAMDLLKCPADQRLQFTATNFEKYGYLYRFWLGLEAVVNIGTAEDAQSILSSTVNIKKSPASKLLEPWIGTGLLTSSGQKWTKRRKLLTPAFHFSTLKSFFGIMVKNCEVFLGKLEDQVNSEEFDIDPYVSNCALDIICETAMGVNVKAQDDDSEYVSAVKEMSKIIVERALSPWLHADWIYSLTTLFRKQQNSLKIIQGFTSNVTDKKRKDEEAQKKTLKEIETENESQRAKPFLKLMLDIIEKKREAFSNADLREEVDTFMFTGHDTVSSATSWAIFLIGSHPDIQENIFQEIYSTFGDSDRSPTMDDIRLMQYLDMVVKESLRLYPSVPKIIRELTEDIVLGGYTVPAGVHAAIHIHCIHRNPKYYEKADEFYPPHFTPERSSTRHPFAFIPFSAGPRNCIGQKFAILEEKLLLSSLIRKYKFQSLQGFENISAIPLLVLRPGNGIKIRISRRRTS